MESILWSSSCYMAEVFLKKESINTRKSYGEAFNNPKYIRALIKKSTSLSEKEFFSNLKEGIYVFRLPLTVFESYMSMHKDGQLKENPTKAYKAIGVECQRDRKSVV